MSIFENLSYTYQSMSLFKNYTNYIYKQAFWFKCSKRGKKAELTKTYCIVSSKFNTHASILNLDDLTIFVLSNHLFCLLCQTVWWAWLLWRSLWSPWYGTHACGWDWQCPLCVCSQSVLCPAVSTTQTTEVQNYWFTKYSFYKTIHKNVLWYH